MMPTQEPTALSWTRIFQQSKGGAHLADIERHLAPYFERAVPAGHGLSAGAGGWRK